MPLGPGPPAFASRLRLACHRPSGVRSALKVRPLGPRRARSSVTTRFPRRARPPRRACRRPACRRPQSDTRAPPVRPIASAGTPAAAARASRSPGAALSASDTTTREAVSPNSVPAQRHSRRPVERLRRQRRVDADAALEAALGQRDRDAALRAVVRRLEQPVGSGVHEQPLQRALEVRIQRRRPAPHQPVHDLQILAAAELGTGRTQEHDHGPGVAEHPAERASRVLDHAHDTQHGRGVDGLAVGLVVQGSRCRR